jgi:hypothetical protein
LMLVPKWDLSGLYTGKKTLDMLVMVI